MTAKLKTPEKAETDGRIDAKIFALAKELALPPKKKMLGEWLVDKLDMAGIVGKRNVIRGNEAVYANPATEGGFVRVGMVRTRHKSQTVGPGNIYSTDVNGYIDITAPLGDPDGDKQIHAVQTWHIDDLNENLTMAVSERPQQRLAVFCNGKELDESAVHLDDFPSYEGVGVADKSQLMTVLQELNAGSALSVESDRSTS